MCTAGTLSSPSRCRRVCDTIVIFGSHHDTDCIAERIESNFKQVSLSEEDYQKLVALGKNNHVRFNIPYTYSPRWDINIWNEPAEQPATHKPKIQ